MITSPQQNPAESEFANVVGLLKLEAGAILHAAGRMDEASIRTTLDLLAGCRSKVVVMGAGKSGIIAQKIAQTLASTSTVAIFVHPSDAIHGSLGVITTGDVVIALSNSGETEEILAVIPALKTRAVPIISIVGKTDSTLARQSDAVLDASVDKEACPLNLAPTTSTTVALAIGDSIAMTLMSSRGLTAEDFAANHPAGQLGKRLTMKVEHLMHPSPNVGASDGWLDVVKALSRFGLGAVNVASDGGRLLGIITDGDLRRSVEKHGSSGLDSLTAEQMMTREPVTVRPDMLAFDALQLMENRPKQISVLSVIDADQTCLGLLRLHDIVRSGL